jgi:hypothetical protein
VNLRASEAFLAGHPGTAPGRIREIAMACVPLLAILSGGCTSQGVAVDAVTHSVSLAEDPSLRHALAARPAKVAILPAVAPSQPGLAPLTNMALMRAIERTVPGATVVPAAVVAGRINEAGLGTAWHDLASEYVTGGVLDRERLAKVGKAAQVRWVLMPMLGNLWTYSNNRLNVLGLVVNWTVSTTVDVSLQAWDVETGQVAWASTGSCTIEAEVVLNARASLNRALETAFAQMVSDLVTGRSRSVERATLPAAEIAEPAEVPVQSDPASPRSSMPPSEAANQPKADQDGRSPRNTHP